MKKNKFSIIVVVLIVLIIGIMSIKPIGKIVYPYSKYSKYIESYCEEYNLNPYLVASVIKIESNFDKNARSHKNAIGLMQITPSTGKWAAEQMKVKNFNINMLYDEEFSIKMGCWYLDNLRREFGDNMELILAAYNGGRGNVNKWLNNKKYSQDGKKIDYIPFKETDKYIKKVQVNYNIYKFLYDENSNCIKSIKIIFLSYFA